MKKKGTHYLETKLTRRAALKAGSIGILAMAGCDGPAIRTSKSNAPRLRWLGWEHYNVREITEEFEDRFGVRVSAGFFDGNSEAYTRLKTGGVRDFDLVMADGFWPRLYYKQGLVQAINEASIPNLSQCFSDFLKPSYNLLHDEEDQARIAAPNCWGGYGITANIGRIEKNSARRLSVLFDRRFEGKLATSSRFEENIALAGILACHNLGTKDEPRPDGRTFNPYVLYDDELEYAKELLIKQKELLLARWNDEDTLERLLRSEAVWASPEWSGIYRRIHFDKLDGQSDLDLVHTLKPEEGGLGWVDTWAITAGVEDSGQLALAHEWINFRLEPKNMEIIARQVGWAPCVDVRDLLPPRYVETLFLNETEAIQGLYQFDIPSEPEKWERVWTEVESS